MQSEPFVVSQRTPSIDSSQVSAQPIQHGNDLEDAAVSGFLLPEETGDYSETESLPPGSSRALLSDTGSAPPSSPALRVIEYENTGSPNKKTDRASVSFVGRSNLPLETLPNGTPETRTSQPNGSPD